MKTAKNGQCACMRQHFSPKPKFLDRTLSGHDYTYASCTCIGYVIVAYKGGNGGGGGGGGVKHKEQRLALHGCPMIANYNCAWL